MRIGIVNDLRTATEALRLVVTAAGHEVVWTADNGEEAVLRCTVDLPDAVLMDMIMPDVDGVEATRRIMASTPCPILVVTATVTGNATRVYDALSAGAVDAVNTPVFAAGGTVDGGETLVQRLEMVARLNDDGGAWSPSSGTESTPTSSILPSVLAIGASTGGPNALVTVLRSLPRPLDCAVLIVQHVGAEFVAGLVDWLGRESNLPVRLAEHGRVLRGAEVRVAPGARHLTIDSGGRVCLVEEPAELVHRPSVDVLFRSLAAGPLHGAALLLTGMGRDGADGLLELRRRGWHTIAQDEESSVVWGMPGAAVELGGAVETLSIERIGPATARSLHAREGGTA